MKRKSYILFAVVATLCVCGCQQILEPDSWDGVVEFNPAIGSTQVPVTKGEQLNTTEDGNTDTLWPLSEYATQIGNKFYVCGWNGTSRFIPEASASDSFAQVNYASSKWTAEGTYNWKGTDSRTFFAYANLTPTETGVSSASVACTSNAAEVLTYGLVPAAAGLQNDILMGYCEANPAATPSPIEVDNTDKVCTVNNLVFYHPLTAVRFRMGDFGGADVIFKGIYLNGVYKSGTATLTPTSAVETDSDNKFEWTNLSTEMQEVLQEFGSGLTVAEGSIIGEPFIIIPQTMTSAKPVTATIVVEMNDVIQPLTFTISNGSWADGKTNTYVLNLSAGEDDLTFQLLVEDWVVGGGTITL